MAATVLGSVAVLQAAMDKPTPGMQIRLQTSGAASFPEVAAGPGKHFTAYKIIVFECQICAQFASQPLQHNTVSM